MLAPVISSLDEIYCTFFVILNQKSAENTKVQRIYDGNILDGMSERLESIAEELNRKFQGLTDVDKQVR